MLYIFYNRNQYIILYRSNENPPLSPLKPVSPRMVCLPVCVPGPRKHAMLTWAEDWAQCRRELLVSDCSSPILCLWTCDTETLWMEVLLSNLSPATRLRWHACNSLYVILGNDVIHRYKLLDDIIFCIYRMDLRWKSNGSLVPVPRSSADGWQQDINWSYWASSLQLCASGMTFIKRREH